MCIRPWAAIQSSAVDREALLQTAALDNGLLQPKLKCIYLYSIFLAKTSFRPTSQLNGLLIFIFFTENFSETIFCHVCSVQYVKVAEIKASSSVTHIAEMI